MPPKPGTRGINVGMSEDERAKVEAAATAGEFRSIAAYVRSLIEKDTAGKPYEVKFDVAWGGWRGGSKDDSEE